MGLEDIINVVEKIYLSGEVKQHISIVEFSAREE